MQFILSDQKELRRKIMGLRKQKEIFHFEFLLLDIE